MAQRTFPGVYATVVDNSTAPASRSRFRAGLLGTASRGPVNTALPVRSMRDFQRQFGNPLTGSALGVTVQLISQISDGLNVVRVARTYKRLTGSGGTATGTAAATQAIVTNSAALAVGDYFRITQLGKRTTANARVSAINNGTGAVDLDTAADPTVAGKALALADTYTAGQVDFNRAGPGSANEAEAFLNIPVWNSALVGGGTVGSPAAGTFLVAGSKTKFELTITSPASPDTSLVAAGDILLIEQANRAATREVRVKEVIPAVPGTAATIVLESQALSDVGYRPIGLQDSYTGATIRKISTVNTIGLHLFAATPGTWANSDGSKVGMYVNVSPGSKADTKKISVFEGARLAEEWDNLSIVATIKDTDGVTDIPNPNYYPNAINGKSSYITVGTRTTDPTTYWVGAGAVDHPLNTINGWKATAAAPSGATATDYKNGTYRFNNAAFTGGFNGSTVDDADWIGTYDPLTEASTGVKVFENSDANLDLDVIAAPGVTSVAVAAELARVNGVLNSFSPIDAPRGLNALGGIDWHNGLPVGGLTPAGRLDSFRLGMFWNWITVVDSTTGNRVVVPPTCAALYAMAYTFDVASPHSAAAGDTRGRVPDALAVEFARVSEDAKQTFFAEGNGLNVILSVRGRIQVEGDRTLLRVPAGTVSKLQQISVIHLINRIVRTLQLRLSRYRYEPLDDITYAGCEAEARSVLDAFKKERGLEDYALLVNATNNTDEDRNNRNINIGLEIVPESSTERIFLNVNVRESGAVLTSAR